MMGPLYTAIVLAPSILGLGHHGDRGAVCCDVCGVETAAVLNEITQLQACPRGRDRERAAHRLRKFDWRCHPEAAEALALALLKDCDEEVREEAAQSLTKMRPCLPVVHAALEKASACDPDSSTRHWSRKALSRLGERCEGACSVCGPVDGEVVVPGPVQVTPGPVVVPGPVETPALLAPSPNPFATPTPPDTPTPLAPGDEPSLEPLPPSASDPDLRPTGSAVPLGPAVEGPIGVPSADLRPAPSPSRAPLTASPGRRLASGSDSPHLSDRRPGPFGPIRRAFRLIPRPGLAADRLDRDRDRD